jgi:malate dehydrogenase (oxaloacetate-decarboxylating)(NADP+)
VLVGLAKPVQIVPMNATVSDMLNIAAIAAHDAIGADEHLTVVRAAE